MTTEFLFAFRWKGYRMMTQHTMPATQMILQTSGVIVTASLRELTMESAYPLAVTLHQGGTNSILAKSGAQRHPVAALKMARSDVSSGLPRGSLEATVEVICHQPQ
jgi:hypothetical protein